MQDKIIVRGAREHNLKNIHLELPKHKLITITGLSGSGKSTLAFDTIYAEGQRRYVESLSAYARQFLGLMQKPALDSIEGLSPAISIEQKTTSKNPRSTVGTVTEIYDYLRLLFARVGQAYCPICHHKIEPQSAEQIAKTLADFKEGEKVVLLAPVVEAKKGTYEQLFVDLLKKGYTKAEVDGEIHNLNEVPNLERYVKHTIAVVIDRFKVGKGKEFTSRVTQSVEQGLEMSKGTIWADVDSKRHQYSSLNSCPNHPEISFGELQPRMFSFNSPFGACPDCHGLGYKQRFDVDLLVPDPSLSIVDGTFKVWKNRFDGWYVRQLASFAKQHGIDPFKTWQELKPKEKKILLEGDGGDGFEGVIPLLTRLHKNTESDKRRAEYEKYMQLEECDTCHGKRLKPESLAVEIAGKNIIDVTDLSVDQAIVFFDELKLSEQQQKIAKIILKEIKERLMFLHNVGLGYLNLSRSAGTLSGGEAQRIRLATQIGANLTGVIYVLDEPSIGLHQRDNEKLITTLQRLRDLGNTLIVVEHDEDTMLASDVLIDMGPGAGVHGGAIVAQGTPKQVMKNPKSETGQYLSGKKSIAAPKELRTPKGWVELKGAQQNNLKKVNAKFPLGVFCVVTGVSGSGKSTLVNQTLVPAVHNALHRTHKRVGKHKSVEGLDQLDKIIVIDQSPIGRTPRSNPATYTNVFTDIRSLFAATQDAKARGFGPGRFSFNVQGGRCETCAGDGLIKIEMHFLPDVYVTCETCGGKRYNAETLAVTYKGKTIADVLDMSVEEALEFFKAVPQIKRKLQALFDVGLGYIKLGQSATTLSGGEAQRIKLCSELSKRATGKTLYVLDEPTTGLHFEDVSKLLAVLQRIVSTGNSVLVIEHNLDVIKSGDYIIDMGPEGGDGGGEILVTGTPLEIVKEKKSHTGKFLKKILSI